MSAQLKHQEQSPLEDTTQTKLPPRLEAGVTNQYIPRPASLDETIKRRLCDFEGSAERPTVDFNKETLDLLAPVTQDDEPSAWPELEVLQDPLPVQPASPHREVTEPLLAVLPTPPPEEVNEAPQEDPESHESVATTTKLPVLVEPTLLLTEPNHPATSIIPTRQPRALVPTLVIQTRKPKAHLETSVIPGRQPPTSPGRLLVVGALALLLLGGLGWAGLSVPTKTPQARAVVPSAAPLVSAAPEVASAPQVVGEPATTKQATFLFTSSPVGASVILDGILLGVTPLELNAESAEVEASLLVTKDGFEPFEKRLSPHELLPKKVKLTRKEKKPTVLKAPNPPAVSKTPTRPSAVAAKPEVKPKPQQKAKPLDKNVVTNPFRKLN